MEQREDEVSAILQEALGDARPPPDVQARIVEGALARRQRAGLWRWALVAPALAALLFWWRAPDRTPPKVEAKAPAPVEQGPKGPEQGPRETLDEPVEFALGPHRATLSPQSRANFQQTSPDNVQIALLQGQIALSVAPLAQGQRFAITTPQTQVEVLGTAFSVTLEEDCTKVVVTEGRVWLKDQRTLKAGEQGQVCDVQDNGEAQVQEALELIAKGASPERPIALLEDYRTKHPDGVFLEEALFHLGVLHLKQGALEPARAMHKALSARGSVKAKLLGRLLQKKSKSR